MPAAQVLMIRDLWVLAGWDSGCSLLSRLLLLRWNTASLSAPLCKCALECHGTPRWKAVQWLSDTQRRQCVRARDWGTTKGFISLSKSKTKEKNKIKAAASLSTWPGNSTGSPSGSRKLLSEFKVGIRIHQSVNPRLTSGATVHSSALLIG